MKIFVISDTHFHHDNMYKFTSFDGVTRVRPQFDSAAEADKEMVLRWNAMVTPEDHVWHLGDVTMGNDLNLIKYLNGHKRLLLGNHDRLDVKKYRAAGFQKVMGYRYYDKWAILSHVPIHPDSLRYDQVNVHGHIHERKLKDPRYVNVCVEQTDYFPVLLDSLKTKWHKTQLQTT